MKQRTIKEILLILFGILSIGISLLYRNRGSDLLFFDFLLIIITFSLSLTSKRIISVFISNRAYYLINSHIVGSIIKSILLAVLIYNQMVGKEMEFISCFILQCSLVDLVAMLAGWIQLKRPAYSALISGFTFFVFLSIVILGSKVEAGILPSLIRGICIINMAGFLSIRLNRKLRQTNAKENIFCLRMLIDIQLIQQLVYSVLFSQGRYHLLLLVTLEFLQAFYLLHHVFDIYLYEPWNQKIKNMKKADEVIEMQERSCDMIVNLSHELKTPVNVIRSALDILILDTDRRQKQDVKAIKAECNRLMNLIQDMIDIQKINTHHTEISLKSYNLVELLENVIDVFGSELNEIKIIFNPEEEEIGQMADGPLMQKGFMLLIGMLLNLSQGEEIFIEMGKNAETGTVNICFVSSGAGQLKKINQELEENKAITDIESVLTVKLIQAILALHSTKLSFEKQDQVIICYEAKSCGERVWQDERNKAVLTDQIRCRYAES